MEYVLVKEYVPCLEDALNWKSCLWSREAWNKRHEWYDRMKTICLLNKEGWTCFPRSFCFRCNRYETQTFEDVNLIANDLIAKEVDLLVQAGISPSSYGDLEFRIQTLELSAWQDYWKRHQYKIQNALLSFLPLVVSQLVCGFF